MGWRTSTAWRLPVTMAPSPFANTITQLNCCWARGGLDQQVRAFVGRVTDSRRIRVNARYVENRLPIAISSGVGPVRHPVGAHAPGKIQHASRNLWYLGLGRLEQLCAGSLGRLELGSANPDLLWGDLRHPSPSGGIREGQARRASACSGRRRRPGSSLPGSWLALPHSTSRRDRWMTGCCHTPPSAGPRRPRRWPPRLAPRAAAAAAR